MTPPNLYGPGDNFHEEDSHVVPAMIRRFHEAVETGAGAVTIGGTGARELTFLWGAKVLNLDAEKAVAVAFLFYLLSTLVSLGGAWFSFIKIKGLPEKEELQPD